MWNSLHVLVLPAVLLLFVPDEIKNTVLGLLTFIGLLIAMVIQPISGALSDHTWGRFGRRKPWIAFGTTADLIFLGILATAGGLPALAIGYCGLQFTSNLAHGPAQGLMHDRVPAEQMGIASGIKNFFDMAGLVVSSLLIGRLLSDNQLELTMLVIAGILLISASFPLFGVREDPPPPESEPRQMRINLRDIRSIDFRVSRDFRRLVIARLLFLVGVYGIQVFAQYFVRDTIDTPNPVQLTGDLLAIIVLTLIGFSLLAGWSADRVGRKPLHAAASLCILIGSLLMTRASSPGEILIFGIIIGAGIGLFLSANWAFANDLSPMGEAGKYLGLTNIATAGAGALSRLTGPGIDLINASWPGKYYGYPVLFLFSGVLAMVSLAVLWPIPENRG
jgi:Na+/melibiose symporter-like transporter